MSVDPQVIKAMQWIESHTLDAGDLYDRVKVVRADDLDEFLSTIAPEQSAAEVRALKEENERLKIRIQQMFDTATAAYDEYKQELVNTQIELEVLRGRAQAYNKQSDTPINFNQEHKA